MGRCPVHPDRTPSFSVYEWEGEQLAGCFACGFTVHGAADLAALLHRELPDDLPPFVPSEDPLAGRKPWDEAVARERLAQATNPAALDRLIQLRHFPVPREYLEDTWLVRGEGDGTVLVPHLDRERRLTAIKVRRYPDWTPIAMAGSRLQELYGAWRDTEPRRAVIVTEGESDTWAVNWWLRRRKRWDAIALGLPHGAEARCSSAWKAQLLDRPVAILFDADAAGGRGRKRWTAALPHAVPLDLPQGTDACGAGEEVVGRILDQWLDTARQTE